MLTFVWFKSVWGHFWDAETYGQTWCEMPIKLTVRFCTHERGALLCFYSCLLKRGTDSQFMRLTLGPVIQLSDSMVRDLICRIHTRPRPDPIWTRAAAEVDPDVWPHISRLSVQLPLPLRPHITTVGYGLIMQNNPDRQTHFQKLFFRDHSVPS